MDSQGTLTQLPGHLLGQLTRMVQGEVIAQGGGLLLLNGLPKHSHVWECEGANFYCTEMDRRGDLLGSTERIYSRSEVFKDYAELVSASLLTVKEAL